MYKTLPIIALVVSVVAVATLIPLTSQAFLGPIWVPFSGGYQSGCGYSGYSGGYGYAGYGGYGYAWPYAYGGHHMYKGMGYGHGRHHRMQSGH
jgi:hypothetical protein